MTHPNFEANIEEFPILEHGLYANHAAMAPWPQVTCQAVQDFARENAQQGPENYAHWLRREASLREMLATLINAPSADDIALLKNTTEGICTVANGIDWQAGDNIVIPAGEFPSNRLPWLALRDVGVEIREVDIRAVAEPEDALIARMDKRTRLLSVSAVQWTDGLRLDLEILGQACQQAETLFFVDAIQQLGALEVDVQGCNIDFLAADGHKWLLAPEGIAVFYCRQQIRSQLRVSQHGWRMVDEPYQFNRDNWDASETASRFEAGSPNTMGQMALAASVQLLLETGMKSIQTAVLANSEALVDGLNVIAGVETLRAFNPQRFAGIVSFDIPGRDLKVFFNTLKQRQLSCAIRGDSIRVSPHFYQNGQPIQEILNTIEDSI